MKLFNMDTFGPWFKALDACEGIEQGNINHPEGDVLTHSLQTFKWACRESNDFDLMLAALLHDVGKSVDTLGHDSYGAKMLDGKVPDKTLFLIKHHMRIWDYLLGDMKRLVKCQFLANHKWLPDLIQLARWDKLGRNPNVKPEYCRVKILDILERKFNNGAEEAEKNGG